MERMAELLSEKMRQGLVRLHKRNPRVICLAIENFHGELLTRSADFYDEWLKGTFL